MGALHVSYQGIQFTFILKYIFCDKGNLLEIYKVN